MTERFNIGGLIRLHMENTPFRRYRPTIGARIKAKSRMNVGLKLGYGEEYTVGIMVEAALDVDFYYGLCGSPDTADHAGVKAWATDLYRAERNHNNRTARRFGV